MAALRAMQNVCALPNCSSSYERMDTASLLSAAHARNRVLSYTACACILQVPALCMQSALLTLCWCVLQEQVVR